MKKRKFSVLIPELVPPGEITMDILSPIANIVTGLNRPYTEDEFVEKIREADALIVTSREKVTRRVIGAAEKLRVISKHGAGIDNIDVETATERNIIVTRIARVNADTVAEYAIALMLTLLRKIPLAMAHLKQCGWRGEELLGDDLKGKTIGIVGLGAVGSSVAVKLKAFDVVLLAYDPYVSSEKAGELGSKLVNLETLLRESDLITIHTALTPQTRKLIGERELKLMKPHAYLINTARGAIVDEMALCRALKNNRIAGAGLDVFEQEPPSPDNPLLKLENVVVTPHIAGSTKETRARIVAQTALNVLSVLESKLPPVEHIANQEVLKKISYKFASKSQ